MPEMVWAYLYNNNLNEMHSNEHVQENEPTYAKQNSVWCLAMNKLTLDLIPEGDYAQVTNSKGV